MQSKTQKTKRKYNLTYILRAKGYRLNTPSKTIYTPHDQLTEFPSQLTALINEFSYIVQTEIN